MDTVLSILTLAATALVLGAISLWRRGGMRKQAILMLVLAAVMAANVAILTLPGSDGEAPLSGQLK
jgi:hypothetical protein